MDIYWKSFGEDKFNNRLMAKRKTLTEILEHAKDGNHLDEFIESVKFVEANYDKYLMKSLRKVRYEDYVGYVWNRYSSLCIDKIMDRNYDNNPYRFVKK